MFKKLKISFLLVLMLAVLFSGSIRAQTVDRAPRININGITGDNFISQTSVLYPFKNTENSLWFTDLRYRISSDDVQEWNLGLGYRFKNDAGKENHIAGVYLYKDKREEYDHNWDMWTLGGEILSEQFDFRINAYLTDDEKVLAPNSTAGGEPSFRINESNELLISTGNAVYYKSMNGMDIEFGKRFTETETIFKDVGVYAKIFSFFESSVGPMQGKQIRINKQFGNRDKINWKIGAKWREDNIRGSETKATFAVSIPFGKGSTGRSDKEEKELLESRMTDQPERDIDVVVGKAESEDATSDTSSDEVAAINPVEGEDKVQVWYVTADGNGDGSKEDPIGLDKLAEKAGKGDIIVLSGDDGPINLLDLENVDGDVDGDVPVTLDPYQQIISSYKEGHAKVEANISGSKEEFKFKPDVPQATLEGEPSTAVVVVTANNTVSGINIESNSKISIGIDGSIAEVKGNININNNNIKFNDQLDSINAIYLRESEDIGEIRIIDNKFVGSNDSAIVYSPYEVSGLDNRLEIENNLIKGFDYGILIRGNWETEDYEVYEDKLESNNTFDKIEKSKVHFGVLEG